MTLDRPVHAPETADGTTVAAVAAPVALGSAMRGDLVQTFSPPRIFGLGLAGGKS